MAHFVSGSCKGEYCRMCAEPEPATHKVGEEILSDDPNKIRHGFSAYVCCDCFGLIFGQLAVESCRKSSEEEVAYSFP